MNKSFNKLKNNQFWSIFPILEAIFFFFTNQAATHNFIWVSKPCQNVSKTNDLILRKYPDRWMKGRTDRPYFTEPFRLLLVVQKASKYMINLLVTKMSEMVLCRGYSFH